MRAISCVPVTIALANGAGLIGGRRLAILAASALVAFAGACSSPEPASEPEPKFDPDAQAPADFRPPGGTDENFARPTEESAGDQAETTEVVTVDAGELDALFREQDGRPMLVNFWATWCKPCIDEKPELVAFHNDTHEDVRFVSVTLMTDLEASVKPYLADNPVPYTVYFTNAKPDEVRAALPWDTEWDGGLLPATFAVTADGQVAESWFDAVTADELKAALGLE